MARKRPRTIRFHVPFTATPPPMASASVGIARLMERRSQRRTTDITLIDAPDNRLLRAGVVVSHRVTDGVGEWALEAPGWAPRLPKRRVEPVDSSADLPHDFARLTAPIARGAVLGPVAALTVEHRGYSLPSTDGTLLAEITDEQVTIRRDGVTTARFREATIRPTRAMGPQQLNFVIASMESVSASAVHRFPTLQQRIGPPATGLTDFPEPQLVSKDATMEDLVTSVLAADLQDLIDAMLDFELGQPDDLAIINAQLLVVEWDLRGLAHVLDPGWREDVQGLLDDLPFTDTHEAVSAATQVAEALVGAVHAPRLGDIDDEPAGPLLFRRAEQGVLILADRCSVLQADSPDEQWAAAARAAEQLTLSAGVAAALPSKPVARMLRHLEGVSGQLHSCLPVAPPEADVDGLDPRDAYELGRTTERQRFSVLRARERFVAEWPDRIRKIRRQQAKSGRKQ